MFQLTSGTDKSLCTDFHWKSKNSKKHSPFNEQRSFTILEYTRRNIILEWLPCKQFLLKNENPILRKDRIKEKSTNALLFPVS